MDEKLIDHPARVTEAADTHELTRAIREHAQLNNMRAVLNDRNLEELSNSDSFISFAPDTRETDISKESYDQPTNSLEVLLIGLEVFGGLRQEDKRLVSGIEAPAAIFTYPKEFPSKREGVSIYVVRDLQEPAKCEVHVGRSGRAQELAWRNDSEVVIRELAKQVYDGLEAEGIPTKKERLFLLKSTQRYLGEGGHFSLAEQTTLLRYFDDTAYALLEDEQAKALLEGALGLGENIKSYLDADVVEAHTQKLASQVDATEQDLIAQMVKALPAEKMPWLYKVRKLPHSSLSTLTQLENDPVPVRVELTRAQATKGEVASIRLDISQIGEEGEEPTAIDGAIYRPSTNRFITDRNFRSDYETINNLRQLSDYMSVLQIQSENSQLLGSLATRTDN